MQIITVQNKENNDENNTAGRNFLTLSKVKHGKISLTKQQAAIKTNDVNRIFSFIPMLTYSSFTKEHFLGVCKDINLCLFKSKLFFFIIYDLFPVTFSIKILNRLFAANLAAPSFLCGSGSAS